MRWSVLVRSFPDNATQRSKVLVKSLEAKKLTMESSGDPVDWMIQEAMASFFHSLAFSKWFFTTGPSRIALHRLRSANSVLSVASQAQLFRRSFSRIGFKKSAQKKLSRIALDKQIITRWWWGGGCNRIDVKGLALFLECSILRAIRA